MARSAHRVERRKLTRTTDALFLHARDSASRFWFGNPLNWLSGQNEYLIDKRW